MFKQHICINHMIMPALPAIFACPYTPLYTSVTPSSSGNGHLATSIAKLGLPPFPLYKAGGRLGNYLKICHHS